MKYEERVGVDTMVIETENRKEKDVDATLVYSSVSSHKP